MGDSVGRKTVVGYAIGLRNAGCLSMAAHGASRADIAPDQFASRVTCLLVPFLI